jgi:hypothetical protein
MKRTIAKARAVVAVGAVGALGLAATAGASGYHAKGAQDATPKPLQVSVLTPKAADNASPAFNVDLQLSARNSAGNALLRNYATAFVDPTGPDGHGNPAFHPGASAAAPGLVVTLSTTPNLPGTPLAGPRTNLAGVFQINTVSRANGLLRVANDWQVGSPGFFGRDKQAKLTVYAVRGTAPDVVPAGGLEPVSNVVHRTFHIGS